MSYTKKSLIQVVEVGNVKISNDRPFVLIAGPCQIESYDHTLMLASQIDEICRKLSQPYIFKASFDKANRTSIDSPRGVGISKGLDILKNVKDKIGCSVLTDVHDVSQCEQVAKVVDVLQIPAFLSRQTDLLLAAAKTRKVVNIKKGQFMAPWDMMSVAQKAMSTGNNSILLCERGVSFGYNRLVSDFRALSIMAETGLPVIFDATHSVQLPSVGGDRSSGERQFVESLARAALAVGCAGVFMEVHDDPEQAPSDGSNMIRIEDLDFVLQGLKSIDMLNPKKCR